MRVNVRNGRNLRGRARRIPSPQLGKDGAGEPFYFSETNLSTNSE
jgi:hypothetical protein